MSERPVCIDERESDGMITETYTYRGAMFTITLAHRLWWCSPVQIGLAAVRLPGDLATLFWRGHSRILRKACAAIDGLLDSRPEAAS